MILSLCRENANYVTGIGRCSFSCQKPSKKKPRVAIVLINFVLAFSAGFYRIAFFVKNVFLVLLTVKTNANKSKTLKSFQQLMKYFFSFLPSSQTTVYKPTVFSIILHTKNFVIIKVTTCELLATKVSNLL